MNTTKITIREEKKASHHYHDERFCSLPKEQVDFDYLLPFRYFSTDFFYKAIDETEKNAFRNLGNNKINKFDSIYTLAPGDVVVYQYNILPLANDYKLGGKLYNNDEAIVSCGSDDKFPATKLTYNCVGYALGIAEKIGTPLFKISQSDISDHKKKNSSLTDIKIIEYAVTRIYNTSKKQKTITHDNEIIKIYSVENYAKLSTSPKHNDIAFYYNKNGDFTHLARYGAEAIHFNAACWNSKLGSYPVYCHDLNILNGYGEVLYYGSWEKIQNNNEEL